MRVIGQEQVAALFGVAPKTIVAWQDEGLPIALRGSPGIPSEYESEACINWLVAREVLKVQGERPQDRLARVQADKIEMENEVNRGLLIPADQLEPKLRDVYLARGDLARVCFRPRSEPTSKEERSYSRGSPSNNWSKTGSNIRYFGLTSTPPSTTRQRR